MLKNRTISSLLMVFLLTLSASSFAQKSPADLAEGLGKAREMCSKLTEQQKNLARTAGYDLESLCTSVDLIDANGFGSGDGEEDPLVLPRGTKLAQDEETGLVSEVDLEEEKEERISQYFEEGELRPFGYDLFAGEPTTFLPTSLVPLSPDYLLGPGDNLQIQFFGKTNESHELQINRNGIVDFPELGPVSLAGLTFAEAKDLLLKRVSEQMIGVQASISLGELRSIQVFLLGEAYKPGAYTVSALSTITNALFVGGGVNHIASLRNIQLKRAGKVVSNLDLYDLLLKGDNSGDARLQSGDVIYIPTVGKTASVEGEVRRPAIYELKKESTVQELVHLAGGMQPKAFANASRIHRVDNSGFMTVVDVDLTADKGKKVRIKDGDQLVIDSVVEHREAVVTLSGHVHYPGDFRWKEGLRISDIIKSIHQLMPEADLDFALIRREMPPVGTIAPIFVDLRSVLSHKGGPTDISFYPRDELMVFASDTERNGILEELVEELKLQAKSGELAKVVRISGKVRSPGEYPLTEGMTLTQLIAAAGGLSEAAYTQGGELSRYDFSNPEQATSSHMNVNISEAFASPLGDLRLQPYDVLSIRTIPEFKESNTVTLEGEVRFPGTYTFKRGELLSDVIKRAGGLSDLAHSQAAVFTRDDLRAQEVVQLEQLKDRLRADIANAELLQANEGKSADLAEAEKLLEALDTSKALGRLVINLDGILQGSVDDIQLKNGDVLVIPELRQEVTVIGEVQHPSAHLYNRKLDLNDYVESSGGINERADKKRIYVVKADGSVMLPGKSGWLSRRKVNIEQGDTIVVPLDADRMRALTVWSEVSQVVYQVALGAAAVNSF